MLIIEALIATSVLAAGDAVPSLTAAPEFRYAQPVSPDEPAPPEPASWWEGWEASASLGLLGSSGNVDQLNLRAGVAAVRKSRLYETAADATYRLGYDDGDRTRNNADANLRNDWLLSEESRWRLFAKGRFEYDDFQDWEYRIGLHGGVGYEFVETDRTTLIGRVGAGVSREFKSSDNNWTPEGLLGADFAHAFSERQRITAMVELYPSLRDAGEYRLLAKGAYEIVLDETSNLTLKLGVEDRYDSDPGAGFDSNDLEYFAILAWTF